MYKCHWLLEEEHFTRETQKDHCVVEKAYQNLIVARKLNLAKLHVVQRDLTVVKKELQDMQSENKWKLNNYMLFL